MKIAFLIPIAQLAQRNLRNKVRIKSSTTLLFPVDIRKTTIFSTDKNRNTMPKSLRLL